VESFLSLYSAVKLQSKLDFPKSLIVTSTIPGEGKTLISCNLAAAFARPWEERAVDRLRSPAADAPPAL